MKSQAQVSGAPQQQPPDAHAWSPPPPANESVTPQSRKVCVVTVSIIYLFTRLQFSACLSNSIIDRELAASRRSAGLRTNSLRQGGLMPGPGEVELAPCGSSGGSRGGGCGEGGRGRGDAESAFPRHPSTQLGGPASSAPKLPSTTSWWFSKHTFGATTEPAFMGHQLCAMHWPHLSPVP